MTGRQALGTGRASLKATSPLLVPVDLPEHVAPRPVKERDKDSANIFNGKANCHQADHLAVVVERHVLAEFPTELLLRGKGLGIGRPKAPCDHPPGDVRLGTGPPLRDDGIFGNIGIEKAGTENVNSRLFVWSISSPIAST